MTSNLITPTFLTYRDMLELLDSLPEYEADGLQAAEIASRTGRVASNLRRDIRKFIAEGYLADGGDASRFVLGETGKAALAAWRKIDAVTSGGGIPRWPLDRIKFNPLNPRKRIDDETIAGLGESIAAGEDVLEPVILYPADENGDRMLHAGERRVRACRWLIGEGRLPAALAEGVMFVERAGTPEEALFVALVENAQREDVSPFEDAQGLKAYKDRTGLSARQIAFKLGRAREGSETGVRDVQEKISTLERAPAYAIAEVEEGKQNFDWLKRQIRKPAVEIAEQLRPIDVMTLAEVMHRGTLKPKDKWGGIETECSYKAGNDPIVKGLVSQGLLRFTKEHYSDHKAYIELGHAAYSLKQSEELVAVTKEGDVGLAALRQIQEAGVGADIMGKDGPLYVSTWLNGPFEYSAATKAKIDAAAAGTADERAKNKAAKQKREKKLAEIRELERDLHQTAFSGFASESARQNVDRLAAQFASLKAKPPFRLSGQNVNDADGLTVFCGVNWRFTDDRPLVLELLVLTLNMAFAFPTSRLEFLAMITEGLRIRGFSEELAVARSARALAKRLDTLGCEFGDARHKWTIDEALDAANAWVDDHGEGLPEDDYLSWLRTALSALGWTPFTDAKLPERVLAEDIERYGIAFGDPDYSWDEKSAQGLARDYFHGLDVANRAATFPQYDASSEHSNAAA